MTPLFVRGDVVVTIADECPARRRGIVAVLAEAGFRIEQALDLVSWFDGAGRRVAVLAISDDAGLASLRNLYERQPEATVVVLVPGGSWTACKGALGAGATAVMPQDAELEAIVTVVVAAVNGFAVLPQGVGKALGRTIPAVATDPMLSAAEIEWLRALAAGTTIAALAERAGYSERSLHRHLARLYGRLGASNRSEAIQAAVRLGVVE